MIRTIGLALLLGLVPAAAGAQAPTLVVTADLPPFEIESAPDLPGVNVELVKAMFERAGLAYELRFLPWARAQSETIAQPDHVLVGLGRSASREPQFSWIAELLVAKVVFFTVKPMNPVNNLVDANRLKEITVRANTPFQSLLSDNGLTHVSAVQSERLSVEKLRVGRADGWFTYELRGLYAWTLEGNDPDLLVAGAPIYDEHVYLAASPKFPDDKADRLRAALAEIRADGSYARIFGRYFGPTRVVRAPS
jgi:polar amino acid transport system substrate-binding protein